VMGVDVRRYRAAAFTVSSGYAGLAGVLFALAFGRIVPDSFGFTMSVDFLAMIIIGGLGSVAGSVAGAVVVTALPLLISHYSDALGFLAQPGEPGVGAADAARLLYGAAVVAVLLFAPGGLAQLVPTARHRIARSNRPRPSVDSVNSVKETSDEANARGGYRPVPDPDRM
jgi:branched-chain amino acid transport system permease protein